MIFGEVKEVKAKAKKMEELKKEIEKVDEQLVKAEDEVETGGLVKMKEQEVVEK